MQCLEFIGKLLLRILIAVFSYHNREVDDLATRARKDSFNVAFLPFSTSPDFPDLSLISCYSRLLSLASSNLSPLASPLASQALFLCPEDSRRLDSESKPSSRQSPKTPILPELTSALLNHANASQAAYRLQGSDKLDVEHTTATTTVDSALSTNKNVLEILVVNPRFCSFRIIMRTTLFPSRRHFP